MVESDGLDDKRDTPDISDEEHDEWISKMQGGCWGAV
jgi:hypothetical protein